MTTTGCFISSAWFKCGSISPDIFFFRQTSFCFIYYSDNSLLRVFLWSVGLIHYFVKKQMTTEQQVLWPCHLAAWQLTPHCLNFCCYFHCQANENTKSSNCVLTGMGHNSMCQVEACWWASSLASDLTQALILWRQSALALVLAKPNNNYKLYFSANNDISTKFPKQIRQNY